MPVKFMFENPYMRTWLLLHQTYNAVYKCEESLFIKEGMSTQQHSVLMAIKYIKPPATVTEIAHWIDRNISSVTMIVNRMEKDGLVERTKTLKDQRSTGLIITDKGRTLFDKATLNSWSLVQEVLSSISEEEMQVLSGLLEKVRQKAYARSEPQSALEEIKIKEKPNVSKFIAKCWAAKNMNCPENIDD